MMFTDTCTITLLTALVHVRRYLHHHTPCTGTIFDDVHKYLYHHTPCISNVVVHVHRCFHHHTPCIGTVFDGIRNITVHQSIWQSFRYNDRAYVVHGLLCVLARPSSSSWSFTGIWSMSGDDFILLLLSRLIMGGGVGMNHSRGWEEISLLIIESKNNIGSLKYNLNT